MEEGSGQPRTTYRKVKARVSGVTRDSGFRLLGSGVRLSRSRNLRNSVWAIFAVDGVAVGDAPDRELELVFRVLTPRAQSSSVRRGFVVIRVVFGPLSGVGLKKRHKV